MRKIRLINILLSSFILLSSTSCKTTNSQVLSNTTTTMVSSATAEFQTKSEFTTCEIEDVLTELAISDIDETLNVTVLNVGQSSCTVLESDGMYMIVDAADKANSKTVIDYLDYIGVPSIQYLLFTHYDDDHIGAGADIINRYSVEHVFGPEYNVRNKSQSYKALIDSQSNIEYLNVGDTFILGECYVDIISPTKRHDDSNDNSVVMIVSDKYGNSLYIGGDSTENSEHIQKNYITDSIDVYVVNHHGSKYSSSAAFLYTIHPQYAIISCGKGNSYGHPDKLVIEKLNEIGCDIYRTDELQSGDNIDFSFSSKGIEFK